VASKKALFLVAVPLLLQLAGCATTAAGPAAHSEPNSVGNPTAPRAVATDPAKDPKIFAEAIGRGDTAWQAGQLDRAIYFYVSALERSPQDATTIAKIGAIEEGRKNIPLAVKAFEMAHAAQPDEPRIAERLGWLYLQQAKFDNASEVFSGVLALYPQSARALDGMGVLCRIWANYTDSIHYFDEALQAPDADVARVLTHRGYAKLLAGDLPDAGRDLRTALKMAPQPEAWRYLAELQTRQHDSAEALESLLKIMDTAHAHNEIGVVLMSMNEFRPAARKFAEAISASPAWYEEAQRNLALANEHLRSSPAGS
jgi:tetratricopeptide (TPR) repeat protein